MHLLQPVKPTGSLSAGTFSPVVANSLRLVEVVRTANKNEA
jgi:hypothetical protein